MIHHSRRMISLVATFVLIAVLLASCGSGKPDKLIYLLIDRTGAWQASDLHHFRRVLAFFHRISTNTAGVHVVVASINDSSGNAHELLALDSPVFDSLWDNPDSPKAKRRKQDFADQLESGLKRIARDMKKSEAGVASPLIEALASLTGHIRQTGYKHVTLVLFSDMVQNSENIDFRKPPASKGDIAATMERVKALHLLPDMHGFDVYAFGVGNFDFRDDRRLPYRMRKYLKSRNDDFVRRNGEIWRAYFNATGTSLKAYAPQPR